jgi:MEMO1 family protein
MSRRATHAGQWYPSSAEDLKRDISGHLGSHVGVASRKIRAIISPHAGYRFAGQTAAAAYAAIDPTEIRRVFLLGPCHNIYIEGCAVPDSSVMSYQTPLGDLHVDQGVLNDIRASEYSTSFRTMRLSEDEREHSIEMQLPFLKYILQTRDVASVKIVPIYIGTLLQHEERVIGRLLSKYFDDPSSLFIISSDFCHWGNRFRFTPSSFPSLPNIPHIYPTDSMNGKIESLDREGIRLIEQQDAEGLAKYLQSTGNTICGRHPIQVLLEVLRNSCGRHKLEFVHYSQSGVLPVEITRDDSSVSYAAAVCY